MCKNDDLTVVSLFVGCGGLDLGFKEEGFDLIYACDNDPAAIDVYKRNIDKRAYVRDVTSELFKKEILELNKCDIVLGGFPCQGFSKAGPKKIDDSRNLLYLEMKKAIEVLKPDIFIAENVDGLSQNFKGKFLEYITGDFQELGYEVQSRILDAASFGTPQYRRRIFFVGQRKTAKDSSFQWPSPTHFCQNRNGEKALQRTPSLFDQQEVCSQQKAVTIRDAIHDLKELSESISDHRVTNKWNSDYQKIMKKIKEGQKLCNVRFADTSIYTWNVPEVYGEVDKVDIKLLETIGKNRRHKKYGNIPNGNPLTESVIKELSGLTDITARLQKLVEQGYLKEKLDGFDLKGAMFCSGLFKRPQWDDLSPTILTNFHNPRYFIHPEENRTFSLRECARLQGFPDDFIFTDSPNNKQLIDGYRLVGNAVPPPLSRHFAKAVSLTIQQKRKIDEAA